MTNKIAHKIPLVVTVGQVAIFPYYILWLKQVSMTFTLFAWLFAIFSFSAALGFRVFQTKKDQTRSYIWLVYVGMGVVYLAVGQLNQYMDFLIYAAVVLQVILGFLQGYFRAWHIEQKAYRLHAVDHYLMVGAIIIGLSFIHILSPVIFIQSFGLLLFLCAMAELLVKK
ncbi:hypothetical protein [Gracilibacillus sp. YIM 98692]|uniref:hypothetical protein n=1 Tax=Gracilibacillus sp. YIM 98692 TaxID=2663532 RepID=UPI0013D57A99|nr:hypothetical protein [Gracilibacillus sp. YIM 98692]